jgi:hypothetical protein
MRYISSSFLIGGVTLEEISQNSGRKFLQNFKELLIDEITKYHSKGLKSIKITSLSTYDSDSLIIDFVTIVNPKHHQQINSAIRRALLTVNVSLHFFLYEVFHINNFSFSSNKHSDTNTNNNNSYCTFISISNKFLYPKFLV